MFLPIESNTRATGSMAQGTPGFISGSPPRPAAKASTATSPCGWRVPAVNTDTMPPADWPASIMRLPSTYGSARA